MEGEQQQPLEIVHFYTTSYPTVMMGKRCKATVMAFKAQRCSAFVEKSDTTKEALLEEVKAKLFQDWYKPEECEMGQLYDVLGSEFMSPLAQLERFIYEKDGPEPDVVKTTE